MASKMNVAHVETDSAEDNLKANISNGIINAYMVDSNGKVKCMVHQSSSQYEGTRGAISRV